MSSLSPARAAFLACLAAAAATACFAPRPEPDQWLAYGFRGPEATFRSYLTALAGDRPDLEYRCLSSALKEREGASLLAYLTYRDQLLDEMPWLKAAARAEVLALEPLGRDRARVHARVDWLFWCEEFEVDLVAEEFYEYYAGEARVEDGYHRFEPVRDASTVALPIPAPEEVDLEDVTEIRAGREWKIDRIRPPDAPSL